jgi:hypothetical protein
MSGVSRRARRNGGGKPVDASVRAEIRKAALKNSSAVVAALLKGVDSSDPMISARSAVQLLEQAFGRVGAATSEAELEPSKMIHSVFRRPGRDGGREKLLVQLQDGRMLEALELDFEPSPTRAVTDPDPH